MGLKFSLSADIDEVYQRLTDPDFLVERSIALGETDAECEVEETDMRTLVRMKRTKEQGLPSFLVSVFDVHPTLYSEEQWQAVDDRYEGTSTTTIEGQPGTVYAEFTLTPTKKGCEFNVSHSATIKIPLIRRKIEKFVVTSVGEDVQKEMAYLSSDL